MTVANPRDRLIYTEPLAPLVTHAQITDAEPGRRFVYRVRTPFFVPISCWEYDITPKGTGCRLTVTTGQADRAGTNNTDVATTLARLKTHVEARCPQGRPPARRTAA